MLRVASRSPAVSRNEEYDGRSRSMVWLDEPNWREQVEDAFKQGISVSLIACPNARGDLKSAILSLAVELMELGFLQDRLVEEVQHNLRSFAVRLRLR